MTYRQHSPCSKEGDEFCPKQTFTMTYSNKLPWLTDALRKSIKIKNCLHAETKANPNDQQLKK